MTEKTERRWGTGKKNKGENKNEKTKMDCAMFGGCEICDRMDSSMQKKKIGGLDANVM